MGWLGKRQTDIYRMYHFVHMITDRLLGSGDFCLALINMLTPCVPPTSLSQIFCQSPYSVLSNSWPSRWTLSHCTWIKVDPKCWSLSPITWLPKAHFRNTPDKWYNITPQQFISAWWLHTVQSNCKPDLRYFIFSKPTMFEAIDVG